MPSALPPGAITSLRSARRPTRTGTYRPFVCTPSCGCFAALFAQGNTPSSCQESSAGVFDIPFLTPPGTCSSGSCSTSSLAQCTTSLPLCPQGETCVSAPNPFGIPLAFCRRLCSSNAGCPPILAAQGRLSGVVEPDSPNAVECSVGATPTKINSNDALECLEQVEAATGPYQ